MSFFLHYYMIQACSILCWALVTWLVQIALPATSTAEGVLQQRCTLTNHIHLIPIISGACLVATELPGGLGLGFCQEGVVNL